MLGKCIPRSHKIKSYISFETIKLKSILPLFDYNYLQMPFGSDTKGGCKLIYFRNRIALALYSLLAAIREHIGTSTNSLEQCAAFV